MAASVPRADGIKSLQKAIDILGCFSVVDRSLSLADISERTGLPKTTTHRMLATLRDVGFIEQDKGRDRYRLGIRLFEFGTVVFANMDLHREAGPFVDRLTKLSGEGVHLCVFSGTRVVTVDHRDADGRSANSVITITSSPAYCTGVGKATLAYQDEATIDRVIRDGLLPYTRNTITDPETLKRELAATRRRGYAIDNAEHQVGLRCIAAPIRNHAGNVFAAISISGPAVRVTEDRVAPMSELVVDIADRISLQLGYRPSEGDSSGPGVG